MANKKQNFEPYREEREIANKTHDKTSNPAGNQRNANLNHNYILFHTH